MTLPKPLALAKRLNDECDASPEPTKYSAARCAAYELEKLHAMLTKAREGLAIVLWDFGSGNKLLAEIDTVLDNSPSTELNAVGIVPGTICMSTGVHDDGAGNLINGAGQIVGEVDYEAGQWSERHVF